ncbi:hypothetical protein B0H16DRAFT_1446475 [Mycena metata]|uniref:Glucose-methanol-choline oxidoreductase N-terminal domain-containing protein n=1 Tax=Mycena metata TaxID=1033252 RepID=A0AAD7KEV2_9AGAR|nr:hypothetical protein B0H16DRAFT_1446475 [Mycena metata]
MPHGSSSTLLLALLAAVVCSGSPQKRSTTDPTKLSGQTFDFVIIGGGTAGLALAARLAEWTNITVAVIEAGSDGTQYQNQINIPVANGEAKRHHVTKHRAVRYIAGLRSAQDLGSRKIQDAHRSASYHPERAWGLFLSPLVPDMNLMALCTAQNRAYAKESMYDNSHGNLHHIMPTICRAHKPFRFAVCDCISYLGSLIGTDYDWQYETTPQTNAGGVALKWPRGKGLGGSSAIMACSEDWGWDTMQASIKKVHTHAGYLCSNSITTYRDTDAHGTTGPIQTSYSSYQYAHLATWVPTMVVMALPHTLDPANGTNVGVSFVPSIINPANGSRSDSNFGYIAPYAGTNLVILTGYQVTKNCTRGYSGRAGGVKTSN